MDKVFPCHLCGQQAEVHFNAATNYTMMKDKLCFRCLFWTEKLEIKDKPYVARIKGKHYQIEEEGGPAFCRGFGGSKFKIKFHDGRVIETTNLWHQGDIPEHFKAQLPDNAEFVNN